MSQPLAYLNGVLLPVADLSVPYYDSGFVLGAAIAEQLRTFRGELFRLDRHMERLRHSLEIVGVELPVSLEDLAETAVVLAQRNHQLQDPDDDLNLTIFITPGPYPALVPPHAEPASLRPTVAIHTQPLPFRLWVHLYERGQHLIVSDIRQVPANCWPSELKCRSRMHYFLADKQARERDPAARALLLDQDGFVTEASTANLVIYRRDEGLLSPPREKILPGISVSTLYQLAAELNLPCGNRELTVEDVLSADEALLTSTSPCVWPVVRVNDQPIGSGKPGPVYEQLRSAWSRRAGVDLRAQAQRFRDR